MVKNIKRPYHKLMLHHTYINWRDEKTLRSIISEELSGKILDVGCGSGRVKKYLRNGNEYIGMDQKKADGVDVVGDVENIPFKNESFDGVICTAVLEHVKNEDRVLSEIFRVLKTGGKLIITIPFIHHYHKDPEDYRRYSHIGLKNKLENNGFSNVRTISNNGVFTVIEYALYSEIVYVIKYKKYIENWFLLPYYLFVAVLFVLFKALNYSTGLIQKYDESMYVGVLAVAKKTK